MIGNKGFVSADAGKDEFSTNSLAVSGQITISNLDPLFLYAVDVVNGSDTAAVSDIRVNGLETSVNFDDRELGSSATWNPGPGEGLNNDLIFENVMPTGPTSDIVVTVTRGSGGPANVQAIRVSRVPEPALGVGLLVGGIGLVRFGRRRSSSGVALTPHT